MSHCYRLFFWVFFPGRYRYITKEEKDGEYYIALELSSPQAGDGGTYKLNAKNPAGESNANLKLNLDGRSLSLSLSLCE
ncbi:hypothetical protein LSH36_175g03027 [Paralvinella palmiformis]|uniref:Immunoglobulin I-set domain-containing protein n=1 Tax=Paralvinella palmiformis TaxID=53620 RepID=A0AAD9N645_9ANNE|nr:hypothetical protein LSH36_175g03027 [Paralvinella palmiformis]